MHNEFVSNLNYYSNSKNFIRKEEINLEDKVISMLEHIIEMQNENQKKNEKAIQDLRTELKEDIAELKQEVATLKEDVAELKQEVAMLKQDVAILKEDVAILKQEVAMLKEDVATLKADMIIVKADINVLKGHKDAYTNNLALILKQQSRMMKILENMYGNANELNYVM